MLYLFFSIEQTIETVKAFFQRLKNWPDNLEANSTIKFEAPLQVIPLMIAPQADIRGLFVRDCYNTFVDLLIAASIKYSRVSRQIHEPI